MKIISIESITTDMFYCTMSKEKESRSENKHSKIIKTIRVLMLQIQCSLEYGRAIFMQLYDWPIKFKS